MRKVEFYTVDQKKEHNILFRTEYYHSAVRATLDSDRWISANKDHHCKVYKDVGGVEWEQIEADADQSDE